MVVHWPIEILSVCNVSQIVVLAALYVKVGDPAELTINVSIL